jgi:hypothetical protein
MRKSNQKRIISSKTSFSIKLPSFHANGMTFTAYMTDDSEFVSTFYSIGGGFVVKEERINAKKKKIKCAFPYPIEKAAELLTICKTEINPFQKSFMKMKNRCAPKRLSIMN